MLDEKKTEQKIEFDKLEDALFKNPCNQNNFFDPVWLILIFILFFWFYPNSNFTESYLKGKIKAYENVLKGFDDNDR